MVESLKICQNIVDTVVDVRKSSCGFLTIVMKLARDVQAASESCRRSQIYALAVILQLVHCFFHYVHSLSSAVPHPPKKTNHDLQKTNNETDSRVNTSTTKVKQIGTQHKQTCRLPLTTNEF